MGVKGQEKKQNVQPRLVVRSRRLRHMSQIVHEQPRGIGKACCT